MCTCERMCVRVWENVCACVGECVYMFGRMLVRACVSVSVCLCVSYMIRMSALTRVPPGFQGTESQMRIEIRAGKRGINEYKSYQKEEQKSAGHYGPEYPDVPALIIHCPTSMGVNE